MRRLFAKVFGLMSKQLGRHGGKTPAPPRRTSLAVEALERRDVPTISLLGNSILIQGTALNDAATVSIDTRGTIDPSDDWLHVRQRSGDSVEVLDLPLSQAKVSHISFYGYGGNDTFKNGTGLGSDAYGGEGNDVLVGGDGGDLLVGGDGDDALYGNNGRDVLYGDSYDADVGFYDSGNDYLDGGRDGWNDDLYGGAGADTFVGEWYFSPYVGWVNYDAPHDFRPGEGDRIV
jgi:Ca2+-binding RTX toxin-like protein